MKLCNELIYRENTFKKIIEDLRDLMNEDFYGAYNFDDVNGKNDWELICSQMVWIQMWIEEATKCLLNYFDIDYTEVKEEENIISEKFYPELDDYTYFKRIRSVCAIHPTDIKAGDKKFYAGWINSIGDDFFIFIYNEDSKEDNEQLKIKKNDLLLFANKWYKKIKDINSYIRPIIDDYKSNNSK